MNKTISADEKLYRSVNPICWCIDENRISSSLFKCPNGVSVDRDGGRFENEIISSFKKRFGDNLVKAVVYINASFCIDLPTYLKYCPDEINDNIYHAEIHDSIEKIPLSSSKAKKLANNSKIIYLNK